MVETTEFVNIRGSDLSGTNPNKTYELTVPFGKQIKSNSVKIVANSSTLIKGVHYTFSSPTITFAVNRYDNDYIEISYVLQPDGSLSTGSLLYTSVLGFVSDIKALMIVPSNNTANSASASYGENGLEILGTGDNSRLQFFFFNTGVIENTYTLYYGADEFNLTELTETTHYTVDLDNSGVLLTSAGRTAIGTNKIYGEYKYNSLQLLNSCIRAELTYAEGKVLRETEQTFAEYTDTDPTYNKITNEEFHLNNPSIDHFNQVTGKALELYYQPLVELSTTVDGDYTTGGTTIDLADATGFPETGTINIGGNKVSYTGKSSNTLTIPASTPSIDDGAAVRGEVIELSREPEGNAYSYTVLTYGTEYVIDYVQGKVMILNNAFFSEINSTDVLFPSKYYSRISYMNAWHEDGKLPEVPDEIEKVAYMIAEQRIFQSTVQQKHIDGKNDFRPTILKVSDDDIKSILMEYKTLNVGSSPYNKTKIS